MTTAGESVTFCVYDWPNNVCGPATWLSQLLPRLKDHNIDARCLVMCWDASGPLLTSLRDAGVDCREFVCAGDAASRVHWILECLRKSPPDVFVPNLVVPAMHAARWVRAAGIPTIGVLHSDDRFYRAVCNVFGAGDKRHALSDLVCVSREIEQQVAALDLPHTRSHRIPYGVEIPARTTVRQSDSLRVAFVGRLAEEQKRISEVTRAFLRVTQNVPGTTATIYGDGPDRWNVEKILNQDGQHLPVKLIGRVPVSEIQSHLLQTDVIALLSDYEGLPIAILEAMACGVVPVCLKMRSGIPELVEHGVTGLVVNDRGDDFTAAVRRLKEDPELWQRLSANARQRVKNENSVNANTEQWATLLKSVSNSSLKRTPLYWPSELELPPVHPDLAAEDPRPEIPGLSTRIYRKSRTLLSHLKRRLGSSSPPAN
jgi:colanic acid/amylovoran biosynthesis glycosyltransferase